MNPAVGRERLAHPALSVHSGHMSEYSYDVVVIGSGPVGENVADRAHQGGLTVCIVEQGLLGGECSYYACIPSKALARPVQASAATARLGGLQPARIDAAGVLSRRDGFVTPDDSGQANWLADAGIALVRGRGRLDGVRRVVVDTDGEQIILTAHAAVVIAVGTDPALPPIPGLAEVRPWTNREATTARYVPERLAVLGGGPVACELAQAWAGLGSQVTLVERGPRLVGRTEDFVSDYLVRAMRESGIKVMLNTEATRVNRQDDVEVLTDDGSIFHADEIIAALGRRPATSDLGLETVGMESGGYVDVDDSLAVAGADNWLYAVGDVNGRNLLTHMGKYQARIAGDVIAARAAGESADGPGHSAWADHSASTQVIFTDPEVCAVGLTEASARDAGIDARTVEYDMGATAGASLHADNYAGRAKLVIDQKRQVIVGATFVGQDTADLLHSATIAVAGQVPLDQLWHAVPPFPTISEIWLRLLESYGL